MPNLAMRQPGKQFSGDGLNLSWPLGGEREIVEVSDEQLAASLRIRRRIAEGQIVITDEKANKVPGEGEREYRLLTGEEARKHFEEPAGPVTRVVYSPATPEDEREYQLEVQEHQPFSDRYLNAQVEAAKAAEERSAAITKASIQAEKDAAKEAKKAKPEDEEEDAIAARLRRTEEASAEWYAAQDKAFMEKEKERQKEEMELLKHTAKAAEAEAPKPKATTSKRTAKAKATTKAKATAKTKAPAKVAPKTTVEPKPSASVVMDPSPVDAETTVDTTATTETPAPAENS
jgi:hypothetical protein